MPAIRFTKMHGLGNDYIYVYTEEFPIAQPDQCARKWSKYHTGIGSDGLVLIGKSAKADFSMRIFNADGSEALMCGNASRCIGKYVYEKHLTHQKDLALETLSGIVKLHLTTNAQDHVESVTVDMGEPGLANTTMVATGNGNLAHTPIDTPYGSFQATFVSMGNPHAVLFVPDAETADVAAIGREIEHHRLFPQRVNVEFATLLSEDTLRMRVWERGSGITQACGTGACATAVAAISRNLTSHHVKVQMDGGELEIEWRKADNHVYMTGPATVVFEGVVNME